MEHLPEEVILHIVACLDIPDLVRLQSVSSRYLALARDDALWKTECFNHSRAESLRRRQKQLDAQDSRLAELRNAVTALPGGNLTAWDVAQIRGSSQPRASLDPEAEARNQRTRALANWEPNYPSERLDYYEEYLHRHADINVGWLQLPNAVVSDKEVVREATGVGLLHDCSSNKASHVVVPLDDGSICLWNVSARSTDRNGGSGKLCGQSRRGLLTGQSPGSTFESHAIMTETGSVECVSIDQSAGKGYFAVQSLLHEVDLQTLQVVSTKEYPWPITALSETSYKAPLSVGTNWTIHLHDPRDSAFGTSGVAAGGELIGGSIYSHASLSQPGPLSILNDNGLGADDGSIWVAGRFTSLLNYDRRFFPRLRGTIHSGARIASLAALPYPLIPRSLDLVRNPDASLSALHEARSARGTTMIAAAEYKGKGSLELFGLPRVQPYQNRQTASASKLLSAVPHGGRIVFSDGDGNMKWVERDGFLPVRTFNINDAAEKEAANTQQADVAAHGIWSSSSSELPGQGDIVQKILPLAPPSTPPSSGRWHVNQSNLLLWTGDGRLGVLGFGPKDPLAAGADEWHDALEAQAQSAEERAREDAERQYGMAMRRALERNADEVRFVRGLGMGFMR